MNTNKTPEQIARDNIDEQLEQCLWVIQDKKDINLGTDAGVAVDLFFDCPRFYALVPVFFQKLKLTN